jgi:hypothetical protein
MWRTLQIASFCPISASGSNFNPRNTQCIPVVKIIAFLEREQKYAFFKGLMWRMASQAGNNKSEVRSQSSEVSRFDAIR